MCGLCQRLKEKESKKEKPGWQAHQDTESHKGAVCMEDLRHGLILMRIYKQPLVSHSLSEMAKQVISVSSELGMEAEATIADT